MRRRSLIAALVMAAMALPSAASARVAVDRQAPTFDAAAASPIVVQAGGRQGNSNGFDWADAGIGAAVAVALIGAARAVAGERRRPARHAATS